jgi:hypothetical protein
MQRSPLARPPTPIAQYAPAQQDCVRERGFGADVHGHLHVRHHALRCRLDRPDLVTLRVEREGNDLRRGARCSLGDGLLEFSVTRGNGANTLWFLEVIDVKGFADEVRLRWHVGCLTSSWQYDVIMACHFRRRSARSASLVRCDLATLLDDSTSVFGLSNRGVVRVSSMIVSLVDRRTSVHNSSCRRCGTHRERTRVSAH